MFRISCVANFCCLCITLILPTLCQAEVVPNELTEAERRAGWQLLFDGKTADGWRNYQRDHLSDGWQVVDGALTRVTDGAGDLITKDQFQDFELSLEYKISKDGNSGVMFHVTEEFDRPYHSGPEVQVQDNVDGRDGQLAGWLYQLYRPVNPGWQLEYQAAMQKAAPDVLDATRPAGEWNSLYLRVAPQGEVVVNGVHYYYFHKGSDDWNERVSKSKFAQWDGFGKATKGHICLQDHGDEVAYRNIKIRVLSDTDEQPEPVDGTLELVSEPAFPKLEWDRWPSAEETGKVRGTRPLSLTHGNDGTNRLFAAMQSGAIYVFKNDPAVAQSHLFLDLTGKVMDWHDGFVENEEGLLGLAMHPQFKSNGEFFVYYTPKGEPRRSVVSRFRRSADDPNRADPASEQVLLEIPQPFPNHNGGCIAFGPDGNLYVALGDGGLRNDYLGLAQDLTSFHGSILRIDVDHPQGDKPYGIPADNPFVRHATALPEIYAYGFRNIWRMAFDRETGQLWVGDVGQDLLEEINIVVSGGNYGWSMREGTKPFGNRDLTMESAPIDPIWEYDHKLGKSVTGGVVYRGDEFAELVGHYLYADVVTGRIWALQYDAESGKTLKNLAIPSGGAVVLAFAEDENGEVYYITESATGQSIHRFKRSR